MRYPGVIMRLIQEQISMPDPLCRHERTQVIAEDDDTQYVECLDCGEIFEAGELQEGTGSEGSLSDA